MNNTYQDVEEAIEAGNQWVNSTSRNEMLDFLMETASLEFKDNLLNGVVSWMGASDFADFFQHIRRNWDIRTPPELDYEMNR